MLAINLWSEAGKALQVGDVVMKVDGRQIGNDGKLSLRCAVVPISFDLLLTVGS